MATSKNTAPEFGGYPSAREAAVGEAARVSALIFSIGHLSELLEDCAGDGASDVFPIATAIQALVESAQKHGDIVDQALESMNEASHG